MTRTLVLLGLLLLGGCALRPVAVDESHLPRQAELAAVPFFPQEDYQCGPAALATVLVDRGIATSPEALVGRVYLPARQGSLQVEMVAAARAEGMLVYPLGRQLEDILAEVAAGNPVLVLQNLAFDRWPQWHFAVVVGYDLDSQTLVLRSGTERRQRESFRAFLRTWHKADRWAVVALEPDRLPATAQLVDWLQAASDLEQTGQSAPALRAYRTAAAHWSSGLPWFAIANLRYRQGDLVAAEQALRRSVAVDAAFQPAWLNLEHVLAERGCAAQAEQAAACARQLDASGVPAACTPVPACPEG